jgi:hypothetical protein
MKRWVNRLDVSDVRPKLTTAEWRKRLIVFVIGASAILACAYYAYRNVYLPYLWRSQVSEALKQIGNLDRGDADRFLAYPEMIKLELLAEKLSYGPKSMDLAKRIVGVKAALELADLLGSPAARYLYGTALLSGRLGMTDKQQAHRQFELGVQRNAAQVNQGNARATLYYAVMMNAGYGGLEQNISLSTSMIQHVMRELPREDLITLQYLITGDTFIVDREALVFGDLLLVALLDRGEDVPAYMIDLICEKTLEELYVKGCIKRVAQSQTGKTNTPTLSSNALVPVPALTDRERQKSTGYVKGAPQAAMGGMSTFSIDNKQGSSDAIGRLYKNGAKPAVRSIYVKAGETFKAQSLIAGSYVFRYRFIGSDTTYEADQQINLSESQTETGTRYSTVTVTLFKEIGGNLPVKQVPADNF